MKVTPEQVDSRTETALPENLSETFYKAYKNKSQNSLKRF